MSEQATDSREANKLAGLWIALTVNGCEPSETQQAHVRQPLYCLIQFFFPAQIH